MLPDDFIRAAAQATNLVDNVDGDQLATIGGDVCQDYDLDYSSMSEWLERMKRGLDLASMLKKDKNYPFSGAANVMYPLIASAALQFNARAYPAIVPATDVVKARVNGRDVGGEKAARGKRVSEFMSWQLLSDVEEWDAETDKLLVQLPIVGTMVRKVWFDPARNKVRCRVVEPGKFVVNAKVRVLNEAPRISEEIELYPAEIQERKISGVFKDVDLGDGDSGDGDRAAPHKFIEQHCRLDLDDDGYPEPYIVTVHKVTQTVVRVVADYDESGVSYEMRDEETEEPAIGPMGEPIVDMMGNPVMIQKVEQVPARVTAINRGSYFIDYHFIPALDGGFWGVGLGLLLGDLSDTVNTIINQTLDAGHYASLGGGFIGSELRLKGGAQRMRPGEWKTVGATGSDVKSAIVPMTFPGPDATMLNMLGMLVDAAREISSTQEILSGDTGTRNMTATTTLALIDQGLKVFTAAYKRIFRSLSKEFRLIAGINRDYLSPDAYSRFLDEQADPRRDFDLEDFDIQPVADPNAVTKMQQMAKAQLLSELADGGMVDKGVATQKILEAADIPEWEDLMPKPDPAMQQMQQAQAMLMDADIMMKMAALHKTKAEIEEIRSKAIKNMADADAAGARLRLDALTQMMDALNNDLERHIAGRMGRLAGESGNGSAPQMPQVNSRPPQGGIPPILLERRAGAGGPVGGPADVAGFP